MRVASSQLPWIEGPAEDFIPFLPETWDKIISQQVVTRPLIDVASETSKAPFTPAQGRHVSFFPQPPPPPLPVILPPL
jgi:hypothetical protein